VTHPTGAASPRLGGIGLAVAATVFFSTSAVLIRSAEGFTPLEVASYRLLAGAGLVGLFAAAARMGPARSRVPGRPRTAPAAVIGAGVVAALHFAFYIASLYRTTISHSLVLVNMSPLLAIPLSAVFLRERFDPRRLPAVLLSIVGLGIMVGLEPGLTGEQLVGDGMALLAALAYAVYSLIGRSQKSGSGLLTYAFRVYLVAGLALLPLALWQRAFTLGPAPGPQGFVAIGLLALLPTAGGHTLYNAALRRADAATVNLIATQEVTGGVLLGLVLLGEVPSVQAVVGGLVTLVGLYLAVRGPFPARRSAMERGRRVSGSAG